MTGLPPHPDGWARGFEARRCFLVLALVFGTALALLTPPFQAPDEMVHFYRAYQVSTGALVPTLRDGLGGGEIPRSLPQVSGAFGKLPRHPEAKTSRAEIMEVMRTPLAPQDTKFLSFPNASIYPPVLYFPQAAAMAVGRALGVQALGLMYAGRLANLLVWALLGWAALRITPMLDRAFLLLLLMPMSLAEAASLSTDGLTNGVTLVFTALILRHATQRDRVLTMRDGALLALVVAGMVLTKYGYYSLFLLIFLIPVERLGPRKRYAMFLGSLALAGALAFAAWSLWSPFRPHYPQPAGTEQAVPIDEGKQLAGILGNPMGYVRVLWNTLRENWAFYRKTLVGHLGWLDTELPNRLIQSYLVLLVLGAWPRGDEARLPKRWLALLLTGTAALVSMVFIATLIYVYWTPVGSPYVQGLQGRYLIPVVPAMLVFLRAGASYVPAKLQPSWGRALWNILTVAAVCAALIVTLMVVYRRYYVAG